MCGIVGLFLKNDRLNEQLGAMFARMLGEMTERGPDSAGIAVYRDPTQDEWKITLQSRDPDFDWTAICRAIEERCHGKAKAKVNDSHCVILTGTEPDTVVELVESEFPDLQIMSVGQMIEIYKETGLPDDVISRFGIQDMKGSHAVGHTRMATESAVTTAGSHPFSTGRDVCLVHNGSLSNHNRLRDRLERRAGMNFRTENDTEVAAAYIAHRLQSNRTLHAALEDCVDELDGFYTFVAGTADGFAVLRDPFACKPAVLAETDDYVAFGSEYRALASLPGVSNAAVWEPKPAIVYSWSAN